MVEVQGEVNSSFDVSTNCHLERDILNELDQDHLLPLLLEQLRRLLHESGNEECFRKDDRLLIAFLRVKNYSVERAWNGIQRLVRVLKENPDLLQNLKPSQLAYIYDLNILLPLKERCRIGGFITVMLARNWNPNTCSLFQISQAYLLAYAHSELYEADAKMTQLIGNSIIIDYKDVPFTYLRFLSPRHIKLLLVMFHGGMPSKLVGLHILNFPYFLTKIYQFVRRLVPSKIRKRIHFHKNPESLNEYFHLDSLPLSIGGGLEDRETIDSQLLQTVLEEDNGFEEYFGNVWQVAAAASAEGVKEGVRRQLTT